MRPLAAAGARVSLIFFRVMAHVAPAIDGKELVGVQCAVTPRDLALCGGRYTAFLIEDMGHWLRLFCERHGVVVTKWKVYRDEEEDV